MNPTNELVNDFVTKQFGETAGAFCTKCHTPIGSVMGEPFDMPNKDRTPLSLTGVSCVVCHSIDEAHGKSQTYIQLKPSNKVYGPHGKGSENDPPPVKVDFHQAEQRDVFKSSQMCRHCHEVTMPNALRLQETYSEWKNSPGAKEGVTCQSCHMGPVPGKPTEYPVGQIAEVADLELPERPLSNHSFIGWTIIGLMNTHCEVGMARHLARESRNATRSCRNESRRSVKSGSRMPRNSTSPDQPACHPMARTPCWSKSKTPFPDIISQQGSLGVRLGWK